jgi:hypothetical protein
MCRNWVFGPNLQCLISYGGSIQQCVCNSTQYFDYGADYCYTAKSWQQPCNSSHVMQHQCVIKRDHFHVLMVYVIVQVLSGGIHRHALLKVNKKRSCFNIMMGFVLGTYLDSCTTGQTFQCQDYNLLSCISSQCQCGSLFYWSSSSNYCVAQQSYLGSCTSITQCVAAVGVGLSCQSGQCLCSTGYHWNSTLMQCM